LNVIFVLCDSLIRDYLGPYGGTVRTPNLDCLAKRACTFTNHWIGSSPCMPARRELWSGRLEFPWRSWGPLEPWDPNWAKQLTEAGLKTCLITDHANLFATGAGNYHHYFTGYEFIRGHGHDHWETRDVNDPAPAYSWIHSYRRNVTHRTPIEREEQSFAARTLSAAGQWLDNNAGKPFFLMVDEFDPHIPYDPPEPYRSMYSDDQSELPLSPHGKVAFDDPLAKLTRARYAGKLTMVDKWLGRVFDRVDWENTVVILTTDHGEECGEHGLLGKGHGFNYPEYSRIPLLVHLPGGRTGKCDAVTTTVDLHSTVIDALGQTPHPAVHGRSLLPLLRDERQSVREAAMFGWWGRGFYCTDGKMLMCKAAVADGPKFQYGTNLGDKWVGLGTKPFDRYAGAEMGRYLPHVDVPVYRVPMGKRVYGHKTADFDAVFDLVNDPPCTHNLWDTHKTTAMEMLVAQMRLHQVPLEHNERLGLNI